MVNDDDISDSSPISRLSGDILWLIFLMNANMYDPLEYDVRRSAALTETSALETTLSSTHVCKSWRVLLLESTTIWGRILRLDRLYVLGREGALEILGRTGSAPLCVMGSFSGASGREGDPLNYNALRIDESTIDSWFATDFVVPLFQMNWWRVQKIHVSARDMSGLPDSLWKTFTLEAPNLDWFAFAYPYQPRRAFDTSEIDPLFGDKSRARLFDGNAPSLQHLHVDAMTFRIEGTQWLGQLRSLELDSSRIPAPDVLTAIEHTPRLEFLRLSGLPGEVDPHSVESESIHLPHLADLRVALSFHTSLAFARSIRPARNCAISYCSESVHDVHANEKDIIATVDVLERYTGMYFSSGTDLAMNIGNEWQHSFSLSACACDIKYPPPRRRTPGTPRLTTHEPLFPYFAIKLPQFSGRIDTSQFFTPFLKSDLSSVQVLILGISLLRNAPFPLLEVLTGVTSLGISDANLTSITKYQAETTRILFPKLRTLQILRTEPIHVARDGFNVFYSHREAANLPRIQVLGLGKDPEGNWSFLKDKNGLKVVWQTWNGTLSEYVCGSGNAEELNFSEDLSEMESGCDFDHYGYGSD